MSKARGPMGHGHGHGMSGEKAKDFKSAMKRLFRYMKRYRIQLGIMMIFAVGSTIFNIIGPKILGDSTGLSAFWVVFSILFGGGMFGFAGMILGVPTFAVIYYIVKMLVNHQLEKHMLPTDTGAYDQMSYINNEGKYIRIDEETEKKEEKEE